MKNIIKVVIALIVVSGFMISCETTTYQDLGAPVAEPTYTKNISTIMSAKCINCHDGYNQSNLTTYDDVKNSALNGSLICSLEGESCELMPQGGSKLPDNTIQTVKNWITNGCPE